MTDLTDRMRTCAAYMIEAMGAWEEGAGTPAKRVCQDAVDLLIAGSNLLEAIPQPLGEPMEIIEPLPAAPPTEPLTSDLWTDPGVPTTDASSVRNERNPRACPKCDSRSAKRVYRDGRRLMLQCPACSTAWQYKFEAKWG